MNIQFWRWHFSWRDWQTGWGIPETGVCGKYLHCYLSVY